MAIIWDDFEFQPAGTSAEKKAVEKADSYWSPWDSGAGSMVGAGSSSRMDDGLGHYSLDGGATWLNDSGGAYDWGGGGGGTSYPLAPSVPPPPEPTSSDPFGYSSPYAFPPSDQGNTPAFQPQFDNGGNVWLDFPGGGGWVNNVGQIWDSGSQSWADTNQPSALGEYYAAAQQAPSWSDISQARTAWENTSNAGRSGSRFDRMGFESAPTNGELSDWYTANSAPPSANNAASLALNYGGGQDEFIGQNRTPIWAGGMQGTPNDNLLHSFSSKASDLVGQGASAAGAGYDWYTKNIQTPFAETASQLTGPVLRTASAVTPGMGIALEAGKALGLGNFGYGGLKQLGGSVAESGGNPVDFRDIQNEKFAQRPLGQQLLASTIYDPTNLLGAGIGAKALETGAVTGRIARGVAVADKAFEVAQAKAALPVMGAIGGYAASAMTGGDTKDNLIAAVVGAVGATVAPRVVQRVIGEAAIRAASDPEMARSLKALQGEYGFHSPAELFARAAQDETLATRVGQILQDAQVRGSRLMPSGEMGAGLPLPNSLTGIKPIETNYLTDLSEHAPVLYHETSIRDARFSIPESGAHRGMGPDTYYSNTPDLALGQGDNRGVLLEFDSNGIQGKVNKSKPAWSHLWDEGQAEFIGRGGPNRDNLRSITIKPGAAAVKSDRLALRNATDNLDRAGWVKESLPDGSEKWLRPDLGGEGNSKGRLLWNALNDESGAAYLPSPQDIAKLGDKTYDIATSPASLVARAYGNIPGLNGYGALPDQLGLETIAGLRNSSDGLRPSEKVGNWIRSKVGEDGILADALNRIGHNVMNDPRAQPIMHEFERDQRIFEGQSNRLMEKARAVEDKFKLDNNGLIRDTQLHQDQVDAIKSLSDELSQYRSADIGLGREVGFRSSVAEVPTFSVGMNPQGLDIRDLADQLGFYLPRGRPEEDGLQGLTRVAGSGRRGGKPGAEKAAVYDSVAQGMSNKEVYPPLTEATQDYALTMGRALGEQHAANQVLSLTDEAGNMLAKTTKDSVPQALRAEHDDLTKQVISLRKQVATAEKRYGVANATSDELDRALSDIVARKPEQTHSLAKLPTAMDKLEERSSALTTERFGTPGQEPVRIKMPVSDAATAEAKGIDETLAKLDELIPGDIDRIQWLDSAVQRTQRRLETLKGRQTGGFGKLNDVGKQLTEVEDRLKELAPQWREAIKKGAPRGYGPVGLPALSGHYLPQEVSSAMNKALQDAMPISGKGSKLVTVPEAINGFLRGIGASLDISYTAIQGLLGAVKDPAAFAKAWGTALKAWEDPAAFGRYLEGVDARLPAGLTSQDVGRYVTTSGGLTEYTPKGLGRIPFFHQSNRAFGTFGDVMRYEMFLNSAEAAKMSGRALDENFLTGLGRAVDRASGTTEKRFMGDLGSVALFAPRFLQSQLELVGKALVDGTVEGDMAREMLLKLVGVGTLMTVGINEALGQKTDFDVTSSNFMRIRVSGQDVSLFGPWDSLVRIAVNTNPVESISKSGVSLKAPDLTYGLRSKASPIVGHAWDLTTGKNFMGEKTRPTSAEGIQNFARGFAPFGLSQVGKGEGNGVGHTFVGLTGLKATPMTEREQRDVDVGKAKIANPDTGKVAQNYKQLTGEQQKEWDRTNGKIQPTSEVGKESARLNEERIKNEGKVAELHPVSDNGVKDAKGFRDQISNLERDSANQKKEALALLDNHDNGKPSNPIDRALWEYYDSFSSNTGPSGDLDFDAQAKKLAEYEASWTPEQKAAMEHRRTQEHDPRVQELYDDKKKLGDSGYFDLYDKAWDMYKEKYPDHPTSQYATYEDWYAAQLQTATENITKELQAQGKDPSGAVDLARSAVNKTGTAKAFESNKDVLKEDWVVRHKDDGIAKLAWKWEYISADKYRKFLFGY